MLKKNNKIKILKVFLDSPTVRFGLREIARKVKISPPATKKFLLQLEKEGILRIEKEKENPVYRAEIDSPTFRFYKGWFVQYELFESGVIDYIWKKLCPQAIILYGSQVKGEAVENSDIDLFSIGKNSNKINLEKYEKILGKSIHLMTNEIDKIPKELKNNLANGIVMKGYLKIL